MKSNNLLYIMPCSYIIAIIVLTILVEIDIVPYYVLAIVIISGPLCIITIGFIGKMLDVTKKNKALLNNPPSYNTIHNVIPASLPNIAVIV